MPQPTFPPKPIPEIAVVDADNPWPGLLSFEESNQEFFRGRDREKHDLLRLIRLERASVLYGISGLGKTSLIQAGLYPLVRREAMLPITIRFDFFPGASDLVQQIKEAIQASAADGYETPQMRDTESLWEYFHRQGNEFWGDRLLTPLLVFDQFEELFTAGGRIEPVLEELADLAAGSPPETVRRRVDENPELAGEFQFDHHRYRILFSIREDYFASMEPLFRRIRGLELHRYQLLPMSGTAALQVVDQARHLVNADLAEKIVRVIAAAEEKPGPPEAWSVEPALLSLLCRQLNERRKREGLECITEQLLIGSRDTIFSDFYEHSMADLALDVRQFVEERLLTDSGHRNSEPLDNLARYGLTEQSLAPLVGRRLVHIGHWGATRRVEISHDRLTGVVRISRDRRREQVARQRAEEEIRVKLAQQALAETRKKEIERTRGLNLSERGWGVLFAAGAEERFGAALRPLLDRRRDQAKDQYWEFEFKRNESAESITARFKSAAGGFDQSLPGYLLLVGSPEEVSFNIQYELGTQYAVGRLHFETEQEYRAYAESVVRAEAEEPREHLRAFVFAARNPGIRPMAMLHDLVVRTLTDSFSRDRRKWTSFDWSMNVTKPEEAILERLLRELCPRAPDLLFTATLTVDYPKGSPLQKENTGAIVDGRYAFGGIERHMLLTAADVPPTADLTGCVVFCFGTSSAGCSKQNEFRTTTDGQPVLQSDESFVSRLPMRLLGNANGGALAFVGHVDTSWASSFTSRHTGYLELEGFAGFFRRIMDGATVGLAMEPFRARQARLTSAALEMVGPRGPAVGSEANFANALIAAKDSRNYIILGDPATAINVKAIQGGEAY